jgi:murein DD-endopeptidase MepM/ murein hydrolase activator NlpD
VAENFSIEKPSPNSTKKKETSQLFSVLGWAIALLLVGVTALLAWRYFRTGSITQKNFMRYGVMASSKDGVNFGGDVNYSSLMPPLNQKHVLYSISPKPVIDTIIPSRPRYDVKDYTVQKGDSVFEIAAKFNIKPETVLWANYDQLNDNPDTIAVGMALKIPPTDGVLYQWEEGDTFESVAGRFGAEPKDIINWTGNHIDLVAPQVHSGDLVFIPNGHREFRQWLIPTIPRGSAGVSPSVYGSGACQGGYEGALGTGSFVWPADNHILSGNDYWAGHLGIDIGAGTGARIYAADSGVIVFAGWSRGGYGNMVMIDHGNGYQTVYAHLSKVVVHCGQSVSKGSVIGYGGDTGNSTGPHLHFEVRYLGGFINPWYVLP